MHLNIITACIRPENLPLLEESIRVAASLVKAISITWYIVFDGKRGTDPTIQITDIAKKVLVNHNFPKLSPVDMALSDIDSGLVYVLDDDNIMHPKLLYDISLIGKDKNVGYAFHQTLTKTEPFVNPRWRTVGPDRIRKGYIDTAQFILSRDLIGNVVWGCEPCADGNFVEYIHTKNPGKIIILDKVLSYYNYLRLS